MASFSSATRDAVLARRARASYGFRALRTRNYRLYWLGQLVSLTGTWMQTTAQAWLVLQLTGSPLALGTVTALQFVPVMLLSLWSGVLADRIDRYRLVLGAQIAALGVAAVFGALVALGLIQLWQMYLLALCSGLINAINQPAQQAFAVELVQRDDRSSAVALNSALIHGARIVGPSLAGVMFEPLGVASILWVNALSFLALIGALLLMDRASLTPPSRRHGAVLQELREGLRYTWRTPEVMLVMLVMAAMGTFGYNFTITLPLIAQFLLNANAAQYGFLSACMGVGSLLAALAAALLGDTNARRMLIAAAVFSLLLGTVAITTFLPLSALLLMALGFCGVMYTTSAATLLQLTVPDALRGRVTSLYFLLFLGSTPIGGLFIGSASQAWGVAPTLLGCAALCLIGVVVGALYRASRWVRRPVSL